MKTTILQNVEITRTDVHGNPYSFTIGVVLIESEDGSMDEIPFHLSRGLLVQERLTNFTKEEIQGWWDRAEVLNREEARFLSAVEELVIADENGHDTSHAASRIRDYFTEVLNRPDPLGNRDANTDSDQLLADAEVELENAAAEGRNPEAWVAEAMRAPNNSADE